LPLGSVLFAGLLGSFALGVISARRWPDRRSQVIVGCVGLIALMVIAIGYLVTTPCDVIMEAVHLGMMQRPLLPAMFALTGIGGVAFASGYAGRTIVQNPFGGAVVGFAVFVTAALLLNVLPQVHAVRCPPL
jgi:hypothetical protein